MERPAHFLRSLRLFLGLHVLAEVRAHPLNRSRLLAFNPQLHRLLYASALVPRAVKVAPSDAFLFKKERLLVARTPADAALNG